MYRHYILKCIHGDNLVTGSFLKTFCYIDHFFVIAVKDLQTEGLKISKLVFIRLHLQPIYMSIRYFFRSSSSISIRSHRRRKTMISKSERKHGDVRLPSLIHDMAKAVVHELLYRNVEHFFRAEGEEAR